MSVTYRYWLLRYETGYCYLGNQPTLLFKFNFEFICNFSNNTFNSIIRGLNAKIILINKVTQQKSVDFILSLVAMYETLSKLHSNQGNSAQEQRVYL